MVKKIDKTKKKAPKKKPVTKAKPIIIYQQKLPKQKCCTDVSKTGEAYTIPLGFSDRLGTTRLMTPLTTAATNLKPAVPIRTATMGTQVKFEIPTESAGTQVNFKTPIKRIEKSEYKPRPTGINLRPNYYDEPKQYFKPVVEEETFGIGPVEEPRQEKVIRYGNTVTANLRTGQLLMPKKPAFEEPTENISFAIAESNTESLPTTPPEPARKLTELEKLNIRYEREFGKPYSGDPNIKLKDYRKMIQDRAEINRLAKKSEKESK